MGLTAGDGSFTFTMFVALGTYFLTVLIRYKKGYYYVRHKKNTVVERRHKDLHQRIEVCIAEKVSDDILSKLKKEKLRLKDEIRRLEWNADEYQGGVEMFGVYGQKPLVQK